MLLTSVLGSLSWEILQIVRKISSILVHPIAESTYGWTKIGEIFPQDAGFPSETNPKLRLKESHNLNFGFIHHEIQSDFERKFTSGVEGKGVSSLLPRRGEFSPKAPEYQMNKPEVQVYIGQEQAAQCYDSRTLFTQSLQSDNPDCLKLFAQTSSQKVIT